MPETLTSTCAAPAKVNLCLRVVGRRADGYHLLDSIFAAIDLCDRVEVSVTDIRSYGSTTVNVRCSYPGVPTDASNLAARAAETVLGECGFGARVTIRIEKQIPPGAGLGGGSSNAAAVLHLLSSMLGVAIPAKRLRDLALQLGADVPFFLTGGCARVRGIGEQIEPIQGWPGLPLVVVVPPISVSTAWAFRAYSSAQFAANPQEPSRMAAGCEPSAAVLLNDLEAVVLPAYPDIGQVKRMLLRAGASAAVMSGSGAAVVALVPPWTTPQTIAAAVQSQRTDVRVHCARILPPGNPPSVDRASSYA